MPCGDNGEKLYFQNLEAKKAVNDNAAMFGMVTSFLCKVCKSLPADELRSMIYEKEGYPSISLLDWYTNHLINDLKFDSSSSAFKNFVSEIERLSKVYEK